LRPILILFFSFNRHPVSLFSAPHIFLAKSLIHLAITVANDTNFEVRSLVVVVAVAVSTPLFDMSTILHYARSYSEAAAAEALRTLHHRHIHSNASATGNFTAQQNVTDFRLSMASNMTTGAGRANGTSALTTSFSGRISTENYGPQINFTIWLLTALSATFLALRVYCKFLRHRGLWWDDYLLIASWVSLSTGCGFVSYTVTLGFGRPLREFNRANLVPYLLHSNMSGTFFILAATWSKISFAITVLRISNGWTKKFVWFVIISVNVALGLSVAFTWGQCMPFEKIYKPFVHGTCWPKIYQIRYNIFTAGMSLQPPIHSLSANRNQHTPAPWTSSSPSYPGRSSGP
jgi:hypothetical protein